MSTVPSKSHALSTPSRSPPPPSPSPPAHISLLTMIPLAVARVTVVVEDSSQDPPVGKLPTLEPMQTLHSRLALLCVTSPSRLVDIRSPDLPIPCALATLDLTTTPPDSSSWGLPGRLLPSLHSAPTHPPTFSSLTLLHCFPGLFITWCFVCFVLFCFLPFFFLQTSLSFPPEM